MQELQAFLAPARAGLQDFAELTGADELMIVSTVYDHAARLRSHEIIADVARDVRGPRDRSQAA